MSINKLIGLPDLASEHGAVLDLFLDIVHWVMVILFVGWFIYFVIALYKFRRSRNPKANYHGHTSHATTHIEIGIVILEGMLLIGFSIPMWAAQVKANKYPTSEDTVNVRALGERYLWTFHYPGNDGVFGRFDSDLIDGANPAGIDWSDPNAKDDFISTNVLTLAQDRPAVIIVMSKDVVHNLALIPMRIAQDATPGLQSPMWFTPNRTGSWDMVCGQLCGAGHANMQGQLEVVPSAEFDTWQNEKSTASISNNSASEEPTEELKEEPIEDLPEAEPIDSNDVEISG